MLLFTLLAPFALTVPQDPIDLQLAARWFQEARWCAEEDGGKLWGRSLEGPMLFVHAPSRTAVANREPQGMGLAAKDGLWTGKLPGDVITANTAFAWKGEQWSMVLWPLPNTRAERARLLMHESWHRIQDELGLPGENPRNAHLDTLQGRLWLQLEIRALRSVMLAETPERAALTRDALALRAYRQSLFPGSKAEEDRMELHEGLAEFTGMMLRGTWEPETRYALAYRLLSFGKKRSFPASFAYETGPAYGLLLNVLEAVKLDAITWRTKLTTKSSLADLVAALVEFEPAKDLQAAAMAVAERHGHRELLAAETAREQERAAREAAYRQQLIDGPVLELPMNGANFSFDPGAAFPLGADGTVHPATTVVHDWGTLVVTKGARFTNDWMRAFVSAPADASLPCGDGWTLELKPGWHVAAGKRSGDYVLARK